MRLAPLLLLVARAALASDAPAAAPLLPAEHWAVQASQRLHDLGLAPGWLPAQRAVPLTVVARALEEGVLRAPVDAIAVAPLARAWLARFRGEFPGAPSSLSPAGEEGRGEEGAHLALLGASATLGYQGGSAHELAPAPAPIPSALHLQAPGRDPFLDLGGAAALGGHLAAGARLRATPSDLDLPSVELVGALGPVAMSIGRGQVGYGPNQLGAVVARGDAALDRVELMTTAPVRLPGFLDFMGEFALDLTVARFDEPRHPYHPLLWDLQLQWRPHPRLTLAAIRGVMFGGALWEGIPLGQAPLALFGLKNYRENNVYSGSIRWRLPSEDVLPLTATVEWGTDDEPKAAVSWPGLVVGLASPMLPGLPATLGLEYAYFGKGALVHHDPFPWYSHGQYVGGWATGQTPLGDPLGGNGRALRLIAAADLLEARLRISGAAFVQDRFADDLYAPQAGGRSAGARGEAELRLGRYAIEARGAYERGRDGWSRGELELAATIFF